MGKAPGLIIGPLIGPQFGPAIGVGIGSPGGRTLIIVSGQSNGTTLGPIANLTAPVSGAPNYSSTVTSVPMIGKQDGITDPPVWTITTLESMQPITYPSASSIGFAHSMMVDLNRTRPGGFALLIYALGSTSSANWDPTGGWPFNDGTGKNLFTQWADAVRAALQQTGSTSMVLCWEQGEADANANNTATAYQAWLGTFLTAVRVQFPGIPFVFGKLNNDYNAGAFGATLRTSQVGFQGTMSATTLVSQDSVTLASGKYDGIHYSADGYVLIGRLFSVGVATQLGIRITPIPSFTSVISVLQVTFTDASVSPGSTVTSWLWTFGDGQTSTSQSPVHSYAASGTYTVTLKATNTAGDSTTTSGVSITVASSIAGVTRDATSNQYFPATTTEWTTFLADPSVALSAQITAVDGIYNCNEASGNLLDVGPGAVNLTVGGTPAYQQALTGLTRTGIKLSAASTDRFTVGTGVGPNPTTTSQLWVWIMAVTATPASIRLWGTLSTNGAVSMAGFVTTGPVPRLNFNGANTDGATNPVASALGPWSLQYDRTNSRAEMTTPGEALAATYNSGVTDNLKGIGAAGGSSSMAQSIAYGFRLTGATNGTISRVTLKTLLQKMGFAIGWT